VYPREVVGGHVVSVTGDTEVGVVAVMAVVAVVLWLPCQGVISVTCIDVSVTCVIPTL